MGRGGGDNPAELLVMTTTREQGNTAPAALQLLLGRGSSWQLAAAAVTLDRSDGCCGGGDCAIISPRCTLHRQQQLMDDAATMTFR